MYVDGYLLFAIYFIAVSALAVSAYALWSLEEIRKYYAKKSKTPNTTYYSASPTTKTKPASKSHWS